MIKTADFFLRLLLLTKKEANLEINKIGDFNKEYVYFKKVQSLLKD